MGALSTTNLGISAIKTELVNGSNSLNALSSDAANYTAGFTVNQMTSFRGWQLPTSTVTIYQNEGGIWDGCNFWDVWCDSYGTDPNFGYQGAWSGGFMYNSERGYDNGTFLTFGGGYCQMTMHGRYTFTVYNTMEPRYTPPCTGIYISIWNDATRVACSNANPYDYTTISYSLTVNPGTNYTIYCNVNYGAC